MKDTSWIHKEQAGAENPLFTFAFTALLATEDSVEEKILCNLVVALVHSSLYPIVKLVHKMRRFCRTSK
jgi:hypothetical protein